MKILLINGSPRKGNIYTALEILKSKITDVNNIETIEITANNLNIIPCIACDVCKKNDGSCIFNDDTNYIMDTVIASDIIVFATPVYWWGVSAQLKILIDKFYSRTTQLMNTKKQIGVIIVGELPQKDKEYQIISEQFRCICNYLGWQIKFINAYSAKTSTELAANTAAINEIKELVKKFNL